MDDEQIPIYNPDSKDFTVTYDINGTGEPVPFTIHKGEIERFSPVIAAHIKKHLAKHLTFKHGWQHSNYELEHAKWLEKIEVNLNE